MLVCLFVCCYLHQKIAVITPFSLAPSGVGSDAVTTAPDLVMQYDHKWGYLIQVYMTVQKEEGMLTDDEFIKAFLADLDEAGVLVPDEPSGISALPGYDPDFEEEMMKPLAPPEDEEKTEAKPQKNSGKLLSLPEEDHEPKT